MEAKELRIGNYYIDIDDKLTELSGYELYQMTIKENTEILGETEFRPIPLTEEWLLKFGFVFDSYGEYCKGAYSLDNEYTDKGVYIFVIQKETCLDIEIKYLHQLQNLYFALTNEELTIQ